MAYSLSEIPYVIAVLIIAFTIHEFAHAYVAYKFGDHTAKNQGRLTLSPLAHLDPFGTLLIFIAGFGWARPVPVNRYHFKNPRLAGVLVSVAGPLSNLAIAILGLIIWYSMISLGITDKLSFTISDMFYKFFNMLVQMNLLLFLFNLLPFPPLDGYRIIEDVVNPSLRAKLTQYENYGIFVFLVMVITPLGDYTIHPYLNNGIDFMASLLDSVLAPVFYRT